VLVKVGKFSWSKISTAIVLECKWAGGKTHQKYNKEKILFTSLCFSNVRTKALAYLQLALAEHGYNTASSSYQQGNIVVIMQYPSKMLMEKTIACLKKMPY
jgi:hypothetical protein